MILITTPKDKLEDIKKFVKVIENNFEKSPNSMKSYTVKFERQLAHPICNEIVDIYKQAGWDVKYTGGDHYTTFTFKHK